MADLTKYRWGNYNCGKESIIINEKTTNKAVADFIKICEKADKELEEAGKKARHSGTVMRIKEGVASSAILRTQELKERKRSKAKKNEKG